MIEKNPLFRNKNLELLHGADYNPEQWKLTPEIWEEDIRLMKSAHCNVMSVGIFSWAELEPMEGIFRFDWLDTIMDKFAENGIFAIVATPSASRPAWLAEKYPEVLRTGEDRIRNLYGGRHNHCLTSPVYREKINIINSKLSERYGKHPALLAWHVSNEIQGECHCELCRGAFRNWLKAKYGGDLGKLNQAWWTGFWSHTYTSWEQIEPPAGNGEKNIHGLNLDWKRFTTDQTVDFFRNEVRPLRENSPGTPVTTNFMHLYFGLDYRKLAEEVDIVSWDSYPTWHNSESDGALACKTGFYHDLMRSFKKGTPFMLMESTPSITNWQPVAKLKRPGMHLLSSIQAIAHGADTVQYFQWRKSRGASEKFHGAVIGHCGHENTRVFGEVAQVGEIIDKIGGIAGTTVDSQVAIIVDWENYWAVNDAQCLHFDKAYIETCESHYKPFYSQGIPVDMAGAGENFSRYKLLIAPMLYMVRQGTAEKLEEFVKAGGILVMTYWSGIADENDLCFLDGFPGPLRKMAGIWSEEIDALYPWEKNHIVFEENNPLGITGEYETGNICDLIHAETAQVLAAYKDDFYKGRPALTVNSFGKGRVFYVACRTEERFLEDFYGKISAGLNLRRAMDMDIPEGVSIQKRSDNFKDYLFILNFNKNSVQININDKNYRDILTGLEIRGSVDIPGYGFMIIES